MKFNVAPCFVGTRGSVALRHAMQGYDAPCSSTQRFIMKFSTASCLDDTQCYAARSLATQRNGLFVNLFLATQGNYPHLSAPPRTVTQRNGYFVNLSLLRNKARLDVPHLDAIQRTATQRNGSFVNLSARLLSMSRCVPHRSASQHSATQRFIMQFTIATCGNMARRFMARRDVTQLNATVFCQFTRATICSASKRSVSRRTTTQRDGSFVYLSSLSFSPHQAAAPLIASLYNATE